jgi:hypothetical protein
MLVGSGAVKNHLLFLWQAGQLGLELLEGKGPLQLQAAAFGLIWVSADQETLAGFHLGIDLLRGDALWTGHWVLLSRIKVTEIAPNTEGNM